MIKIILEPARNGVIKKVIDDNYGGGKEHFTSTDVYESNENDKNQYSYVKRFFFDFIFCHFIVFIKTFNRTSCLYCLKCIHIFSKISPNLIE